MILYVFYIIIIIPFFTMKYKEKIDFLWFLFVVFCWIEYYNDCHDPARAKREKVV